MELLYNILVYSTIFIFGLLVGSFLNVCIFRLPKEESIIKGSSHCMSCGEKIKRYDLIPVFSWLILGGKCRSCKTKISPRYPLIELLNAIMWLLTFLYFGVTYKSLVYCLIISALIIVAFMDLDTQVINVGVIIFIALMSIPLVFLSPDVTILERLIGLIIISVPFLIIGFLTEGIGFGDVLLIASAGLILGYKNTIVAAFIGIILAAVIGIIYKLITKKSKFAFGPYLSLGILISMFFGNEIVKWYLSLVFRN